jgi:hypothetical protein
MVPSRLPAIEPVLSLSPPWSTEEGALDAFARLGSSSQRFSSSSHQERRIWRKRFFD